MIESILLALAPAAIFVVAAALSRRASSRELWTPLAVGAVALLPAALFQLGLVELFPQLETETGTVVQAYVNVGFVEELSKIGGVFLVGGAAIGKQAEPGDLRRLAFTSGGVGFGVAEALVYGLALPEVAFVRGLSSVPLHAAATSFGGAVFLTGRSPLRFLLGVGLAAVVHGTYNILLLARNLSPMLAFLPIVLATVALGLLPRRRH